MQLPLPVTLYPVFICCPEYYFLPVIVKILLRTPVKPEIAAVRQNSYSFKLKLTYLVFFVNSCFRIFTFFPAYSSHYPAYSSDHLFSHPWQEAAQMSLPVLLSVSRIQILIIFYQKKERLVLLSGHLCHSFCLYLSFLFSVFIGCF